MNRALVASVLFCIVYALQIVLQERFVRTTIEPLHLNFLSYGIAAVCMLLILGMFQRQHIKVRPNRSFFLIFIGATLAWILADFAAVYGFKFSSSLNYSLLSRTMIFITFLFSILFLEEKFIWRKVGAALIAVFGSTLVVYQNGFSVHVNAGDILFLISVISISLSSVIRQKLSAYVNSAQVTGGMFLAATVILGFITVTFYPLNYPIPWAFVSINAIESLIGFNLVNFAIQKGGAVFFTLITNLLPLFTVLFSFFILGQVPSLMQLAGGILIIYSIYLFQGNMVQYGKQPRTS